MDERRFQISVSILLVIFFFSLARVITNSNPIYSITEPVVLWLNDVTKDFGIVSRPDVSPADVATSDRQSTLEDENTSLREQLKLVSSHQKLVTAEVERRDIFGFSKTVWVGSGKSSGVSKGNVATVDGAFFGQVIEVYENSAVVRLVTDPMFRATVVADSNSHGLVKVSHGSVIVDLLPSKSLAGKTVSTDGLDSELPSGILIGKLGQESGDKADVFGRYNLTLPYNAIDVDFIQIKTMVTQ